MRFCSRFILVLGIEQWTVEKLEINYLLFCSLTESQRGCFELISKSNFSLSASIEISECFFEQ